MAHFAWIAANVLMTLMFAFSAAVNFNDPDPVRWVSIYGAAMLLCIAELFGRAPFVPAAIVSAIALSWAATISPRVVGKVPFRDMFGAFEMKNLEIEESREMYGLLIVAVWIGVVAIVAWGRRGG